jgi:hypothetical protein
VKDEEARVLLEQLRADSRLQVELTSTRNRGQKHPAVKILFKRERLSITIKRMEEWPSVKQAWGLS